MDFAGSQFPCPVCSQFTFFNRNSTCLLFCKLFCTILFTVFFPGPMRPPHEGFSCPRYEGEWLNDQKHGHGEEHYVDGGRFSGSSLASNLGTKGLRTHRCPSFFGKEWLVPHTNPVCSSNECDAQVFFNHRAAQVCNMSLCNLPVIISRWV